MNPIEEILEFNLIRDKLSEYACLQVNKNKIKNLSFSSDEKQINIDLQITNEGNKIYLKYGKISFNEIGDIQLHLNALKKGLSLGIDEIYEIYTLILEIQKIKKYGSEIKKSEFIYFDTYLAKLISLPQLSKKINEIISLTKTINDKASLNLYKIRNEINQVEEQIKNKLNELIKSNFKLLTDSGIMYKNNKLVLALNASHKYALGGIIVDESASGYTSYVQPEAVYKMDLKLNKLKQQESEEIKKILNELSGFIFKYSDEIKVNFETVLDLDFMFAKGIYGEKIKGSIGSLSKGELILNSARHPLIDEKKVVANSIFLGDKNIKTLIITGPNSGGKTVVLKTVGLLAYMNQCGLMISAKEGSRLPVFSGFYADIGDGQSLMSSLSTFSSHITKIIKIIEDATKGSLILLDELGSGTDPSEGEALAMSIIDKLSIKDVYLLTTTHYENLKSYALQNDKVRICSMEFDQKRLIPTYKILKDEVGQSYAFQISKKYGLDDHIIKDAKQYKSKYSSTDQKTIDLLQSKLMEANNIVKDYNRQEQILNDKIIEVKEKESKIDLEIYKIKTFADNQKQILINEAKEEITIILEELRNKEDLKIHHAIRGIKQVQDLIKVEQTHVEETDFEIGDQVKILSINQSGKIIAFRDDLYDVSNGRIVFKVRSFDLKLNKNQKKLKKVEIVTSSKLISLPLELNLIGKRVEEALFMLDEYLNKALIIKFSTFRVIHGFGTGKLRKAVQEYLKASKHVESYCYGGMNEGGQGATIVTLKK